MIGWLGRAIAGQDVPTENELTKYFQANEARELHSHLAMKVTLQELRAVVHAVIIKQLVEVAASHQAD